MAQDPTKVKTSREQQLQLKADSASRGRGQGRGKGRGRGRGASKPGDAAGSGNGKRRASQPSAKGKLSKKKWEQFMKDNNVEEWYEDQWYEEWGEDWEMQGWGEPAKKAADEYAWWEGRVALHELATPQNHPSSNGAREPEEVEGEGGRQKGPTEAAGEATEAEEPPRKSRKQSKAVPVEEPKDGAEGGKKKQKMSQKGDDPVEGVAKEGHKKARVEGKSKAAEEVVDVPAEIEEPSTGKKQSKKETEPGKGKKASTSQKQPHPQEKLVARTLPQTVAKQVKVLMNFAHLFAGDAEREDVKSAMLAELTPTIKCSLTNLYWKRPGFGVTSLQDARDIAYFKFNWDGHDAGSEFAWRTMAAVALKCAHLFVSWYKMGDVSGPVHLPCCPKSCEYES